MTTSLRLMGPTRRKRQTRIWMRQGRLQKLKRWHRCLGLPEEVRMVHGVKWMRGTTLSAEQEPRIPKGLL